MRHLPRPRSTTFRIVLAMALLAWMAFGFEAMAHPLAMNGQMGNMEATTSGQATSLQHCQGMTSPDSASRPAPSHPVESGHGCCAFGHCDCASFCGSVVGVPALAMTWSSMHDPVLMPIRADVLLTAAAPHLRPPII